MVILYNGNSFVLGLIVFLLLYTQYTWRGNFNLAVWQFWLRLPNLMYTNTTYNHVYFEIMYTQYHHSTNYNVAMSQLIVHQIYCIYGMSIYIEACVSKPYFWHLCNTFKPVDMWNTVVLGIQSSYSSGIIIGISNI